MNWRSVLGWYVGILLFLFVLFGIVSPEMFLLFAILFSLIYVPLVMAMMRAPPPKVEEEEEVIMVDEDIAHFRERVEKALEGKAVAQRDVELRVLNSLVIDLSIKYDIPEREVRRNLDKEEFLKRYIGERAGVVARMFKRIHDLRSSLSREEFLKEINEVLEAMK